MSLLSNKLLPPCILLLLPAQVLARIGDPPPGFDADDAAIRTEQAWDAYNLPYGALGMVTHVFLLYCLACHLDGRSPVRPWKKLEHDIWNIANTVNTSIVSISLVAVTLSGVVRQSRALTGMAVLQVLYSLVVDGVTVHRYFRDKGNDLKEREGMRWDLTPWLLVLLVASLVNSQFLGTLNGGFDTSCMPERQGGIIVANMSPIRTTEIDRNPRLNGVTGFYNTTKSTDPTGLALVICAMVGGALAVLAFLLGGCCSVFGRSGRYRSAGSPS